MHAKLKHSEVGNKKKSRQMAGLDLLKTQSD